MNCSRHNRTACRRLFVLFIVFVVNSASLAARLKVKILGEDGAPVACRVYLKNAQSENFFPTNTLLYRKLNWNVPEEHFIAPSGFFSIVLPHDSYTLHVEKGKEYLPVEDNFDVPDDGEIEKTYRLHRWVSMNERGWYSADMHAHVTLRDTASLMDGEDLNVLLPITMWRVSFVPAYKDPLLEEFLARADASGIVQVASSRWFSVINEELESDQSSVLVSKLGTHPLPLEFPFEQISQRAHAQGALVDSEKATSAELPAIAGLGGIDFVGLANNHFWRSDCYTGPWGSWPDHVVQKYPETCEGFARAGFDISYALLNFGIPIKFSAGSAYGVQPTPLGWNRVYVHVDGEFNSANWFRALKQGRSFVTMGAMLFLKVNGLEPGAEYRGNHFPMAAEAEITVLSPEIVKSVEIIVNGKAHAVPLARGTEKYSFSAKTKILLTSSSWVAARFISPRGNTLDLAHTSPIYFWNEDQSLQVPQRDAEFMLGRIASLVREAKAGRNDNGSDSTSNIFDTDEVRNRTLEYLVKAKQAYETKLRP